jgi:hypothetical protein
MRLPPEDVKLFYTLYSALLIFVNERHQIEDVSTPEELMAHGAGCVSPQDSKLPGRVLLEVAHPKNLAFTQLAP